MKWFYVLFLMLIIKILLEDERYESAFGVLGKLVRVVESDNNRA